MTSGRRLHPVAAQTFAQLLPGSAGLRSTPSASCQPRPRPAYPPRLPTGPAALQGLAAAVGGCAEHGSRAPAQPAGRGARALLAPAAAPLGTAQGTKGGVGDVGEGREGGRTFLRGEPEGHAVAVAANRQAPCSDSGPARKHPPLVPGRQAVACNATASERAAPQRLSLAAGECRCRLRNWGRSCEPGWTRARRRCGCAAPAPRRRWCCTCQRWWRCPPARCPGERLYSAFQLRRHDKRVVVKFLCWCGDEGWWRGGVWCGRCGRRGCREQAVGMGLCASE